MCATSSLGPVKQIKKTLLITLLNLFCFFLTSFYLYNTDEHDTHENYMTKGIKF